MIYLTVGEGFSGVYNSQVINVVKFLNSRLQADVTLVAFLPFRLFFSHRKLILAQLPHGVVLPMLPFLKNWQKNIFMLRCLLSWRKENCIMARNPIATNMGLILRSAGVVKKVIYDGRGAMAAEWQEYDFNQPLEFKGQVEQLEKNAVQNSDKRLAVSQALISYWEDHYNYQQNIHTIIPCLLSVEFIEQAQKSRAKRLQIRKQLDIANGAKVLLFSGSVASWQNPVELFAMLKQALQDDPAIFLLLLSPNNSSWADLQLAFPGRVKHAWVTPNRVFDYLAAADYGLLIRGESTTNLVAAPTKFAEYLAGGLKVLISPSIGDYSQFLVKHNAGMVVTGNNLPPLSDINQSESLRMMALANYYFSRDQFLASYLELLEAE
jgi:hypothetical protein